MSNLKKTCWRARRLPDLEGTEVAKIYRQWERENNKPRLPIFVLTAHGEEKIIEKCQDIDIDYILEKPFTEKDIKTIKKYIKNPAKI